MTVKSFFCDQSANIYFQTIILFFKNKILQFAFSTLQSILCFCLFGYFHLVYNCLTTLSVFNILLICNISFSFTWISFSTGIFRFFIPFLNIKLVLIINIFLGINITMSNLGQQFYELKKANHILLRNWC